MILANVYCSLLSEKRKVRWNFSVVTLFSRKLELSKLQLSYSFPIALKVSIDIPGISEWSVYIQGLVTFGLLVDVTGQKVSEKFTNLF